MTTDHPQYGLMCEICFAGLTPDRCAQDATGQRWDVCAGTCALQAGITPSGHHWPEVMVTAHRRLPKNTIGWLEAELPRCLSKLRDEYGMVRATSGMAIGGDHLFALAAAELKIPLRAAIPYPDQPFDGVEGRFGQRWTRQQRAVWEKLCRYADRTGGVKHVFDQNPRSVGERISMLHKRNDWMLQRSKAVVALWEPEREGQPNTVGGTYSCIQKAVGAGMPVILFDLSARTVSMPAPQNWAVRLDSPALAVAERLW